MVHMKIKIDDRYYKDFIEKTAYMIFIADENGRLLHANEAWLSAMGCLNHDDDVSNLWNFIHPYSRMHCKSYFSEIKNGDSVDLELVFTTKEGQLVYTEGKFNCIFDDVNQIKIITGILQDVTEKNLLVTESISFQEQLLQRTESWSILQKSYINLSDEEIVDFDEKMIEVLSIFGEKVYADRAYVMMYDFKNMKITNTYEWCSENIKPKRHEIQDLQVQFSDKWYKLHMSGKPIYVEDISKLEPNDVIRNLVEPHGVKSFIAQPMMKDGVCYGCVGFDSVKVIRTNAEIETWILTELSSLLINAILRREKILKLTERIKKTNQYLECLPYGFFVLDSEDHFVEINSEFCHMFGYSKDKLLKQSVKLVFGVRGQKERNPIFEEAITFGNSNGVLTGRVLSGALKEVTISCHKGLSGEIFCYCQDNNDSLEHKNGQRVEVFIGKDI